MDHEYRKHHYVPQWYLRQFGTKNEIASYDKQTGAFSIVHPKDAVYEVGLYDLDHPELPPWAFEKVLSNVENHGAMAVRKAISSGLNSLTNDEREDVAAFVATQYLRVPRHRPAVATNLSATLDRVRSALTVEHIREIAGRDLTSEEVELIRGPSLSEAEPPGVMPYGISLALSRFVGELLTDYRWSLIAVTPAELITSDTPVKPMTDQSSDGTKSVFADVPLDQGHVLILQTGKGGQGTERLGGPEGWFLDSDEQPSLRTFQNLNFMKGDRWVFGHADNPIWRQLRR